MKSNNGSWVAKVALLLVLLSPLTYYGYSATDPVDTEAMLNVSVSIRTISHVSTDKFGDSVWAPGMGSGFLVSTQTCEVWTNQHVIDNAAIIEVFPRGWQKAHGILARVVNSNPHDDIAILHMESCAGMPAAVIGSLKPPSVGDETYVVGNPFGMNPDSISRGIISHTSRYLAGPTPYLQTDAAVNPGNSGGALFNKQGAVIGMATSIAATKSGSNVGIGYALPMETILEMVAALRTGPPSWGDAGISDIIASLSAEEAAIFQVPDGFSAVNISRSPENGPSAGKLIARDVIYKIDDVAVVNPGQVKRLIAARKADDIVNFSLIRKGKAEIVSVTLEDGWDNFQQPEKKAEAYAGMLGMNVEMWSGQEGERGQFKNPVITRIYGLGPAHLGYLTSSQLTVAMRGSMMIPVQIIVNTVTGVVVEGEYIPIADIPTLDKIASQAYNDNLPLLLEIESWSRNSQKFYEPLAYSTTAFYKITPKPGANQIKVQKASTINQQDGDFEIEVMYRS